MKLIVNKVFENIPSELIDDDTYITHDSSLVPLEMIEKFTDVITFSQTSSRSIKFLFENFFHLIYDQPATFKAKMKELIVDSNSYIHFDINSLKFKHHPLVEQPSITPKYASNKGNEDMMNMLIGMMGVNPGLFGSSGKRNIED